jgi:hypothetical protein
MLAPPLLKVILSLAHGLLSLGGSKFRLHGLGAGTRTGVIILKPEGSLFRSFPSKGILGRRSFFKGKKDTRWLKIITLKLEFKAAGPDKY